MKSKLSKRILVVALSSVSFILWASFVPKAAVKPFAPLKEKRIIFPEVPYEDNVSNAWVDQTMASMTLKDKIAQFFMVAVYPNKTEAHFRAIDSLVTKHHVGGIILFQGDRDNLKVAIDRYQAKTKIPLLTAMDAEWGTSMRLSSEQRFPYSMTLGAANDPALSRKIAEMMGQECRELGIHLNFAPVADVNSNPKNPVIGFRSFGENPRDVGAQVRAVVQGMESQSVLTSIKHFPGHGDTDTDSHLELPRVNNTYKHIKAIDFVPFVEGIDAGASTVMIAHLSVPALDSTGTPSSLSKPIIHSYLKGELGFKGLVVSDALGMKAVADRYGKTEVVVKAFQAGCDILLMPESVVDAIAAIEAKVKKGEITEEEINIRCKRVLAAKHKAVIAPKKLKTFTFEEQQLGRKQVFEKAITVLRNENNVLPLQKLDQKIAVISIGESTDGIQPAMDLVSTIEHHQFSTATQALASFGPKMAEYDIVITTMHAGSMRPPKNYKLPDGWRAWLHKTESAKKSVLALMGSPLALKDINEIDGIDAVVIGYENNMLMQNRMGQFLMGTFASQGKLPVTIDDRYKVGHGVAVKTGGRLKDSQPEAFGIDPKSLEKIDAIVANGIASRAFPGCQIVVALEGSIIYRKSYGFHTYDKKQVVLDTDVYDIASITKIAASTLSVMKLNTDGTFNLEATLGDYIPEEVGTTGFKSMQLRQMLVHQAGLTPWIPFYTKTLENSQLSPKFYATTRSDSFNVHVANDVWIRGDYEKAMYADILGSTLGAKRYKYSDVGYYFIKKIVEKQSGKRLDAFVTSEFYGPMGLKNMRYNPLESMPKSRVTPTEDDKIFRKQLIHGYVHDQGAAMLGGVAGHAGLFSNATDLAGLMQLYLNGGVYGGVRYISEQVLAEYTDCQYCSTSRRGAGFDKPALDGSGGTCSRKASMKSYGHSGFTGTLAWADPERQVNFVFLSNRVYPDAENWKIVSMNIRTEIQDVIYDAIKAAK